jgi:acyl-CoA reductase-like NAD-dependent aldehyde dehydrogenase
VLAGSTTGADFGGGPLADPLPSSEGFLVKLGPDGKHVFSRGLPFDQHQSAAVAVALDASGDVVVTGSYVHDVDASHVIQSAFLVEADPQGMIMNSETFGPLSDLSGATTTQEGWGIAAAPGGFYLGGDFYTQIDVAETTLTDSGSSDVFVARLVP